MLYNRTRCPLCDTVHVPPNKKITQYTQPRLGEFPIWKNQGPKLQRSKFSMTSFICSSVTKKFFLVKCTCSTTGMLAFEQGNLTRKTCWICKTCLSVWSTRKTCQRNLVYSFTRANRSCQGTTWQRKLVVHTTTIIILLPKIVSFLQLLFFNLTKIR